MRRTAEERFWEKVDKRGPDECWEWKACLNTHGYGSFWVSGKNVGAHIFAYRLTRGQVSPGKVVDHKCCRRCCVNPAHLRQATVADNIRNQPKKPRNTSGFKGVYRSHKRWKTLIEVLGVCHYLGTFDTPEEAHTAYCDAAKRLHGEFANTGEVKG